MTTASPIAGAPGASTRAHTAAAPVEEQEEVLRAYVLEDDPDIASLEADLLREMGYTVVTCSRIVELGDLLSVALPHLLVVDVMLPDGDGGDIAELLRETWPGIPAVFVSAASRARLHALEPLGPILAKPFDLDRFHEAVLSAVDAPAGRWSSRSPSR